MFLSWKKSPRGRQHLAATSEIHGFLKQTFESLQFRQVAIGKRGSELADPVYQVGGGREHGVPLDILGDDFQSILICDRLASYDPASS